MSPKKNYEVQDGKYNDIGTPWLRQHVEVNVVNKRAYVTRESALDHYLKKGLITEEQHQAGSRLFRDYEGSHPGKSAVGMLDNIRSGSKPGDPAWMCIASYDRYNAAMTALGRVSRVIVYMICIESNRMEAVRDRLAWAQRNTGIDRLKEALDDLVEWYEHEWRNAPSDRVTDK